MEISHVYSHLVLKNGHFILLMKCSGRQMAYFTCTTQHLSGQEWQFHISIAHVVIKNGNFTCLLTSSAQEWQFYITNEM